MVVQLASMFSPVASAALPAFPGAEGFGASATGGRGGAVVHVTTLAESGPGSLRAALEASGPRVVVFDVSGVIDLGPPSCDDPLDEGDASNVLVIRHSDVTIAGQTAPGGGITLRGRLYTEYDEGVGNVVVRHLRIRPAPYDCPGGDGDQYDALRFSVNDRAMFDHVSVSWGVDENVDTWKGGHVTLQWSIVAEGATEGHPEGEHNYGFLNDQGTVSVLHDLFAHDRDRNPALAVGPAESIGNVAYNVRHGFVNHNRASGAFNLIGNTFVQGPDDELHPLFFDGGAGASYYLADNAVDDPGDWVGIVDDPWTEPYFELGVGPQVRAEQAFDFGDEPGYVAPIVVPSAEAYDRVLAQSGAFPRDVVDRRLIDEVRTRTGGWGAHPPADLFEGLRAGVPDPDADGDGMPDGWEEARGLDPDDAVDAWDEQPGGYGALETYLQERADVLLGVEGSPVTPLDRRGGGCDTTGGGGGLGLWLCALALAGACAPERRGRDPRPAPPGEELPGEELAGEELPADASAVVTWTLGDRVFARGTGPDDPVVDVSAAIGAGVRERWLVPSPSAAFFVVSSDRGDGEGEILARADGALAEVEAVRPEGAAVYLEGMAAVSDDGDLVVFPASGGPNAIDLFVTRRGADGRWQRAEPITGASPRPYNNQPSWSRDGSAVWFNCGAARDPESGDNDACRVAVDGGPVEVVVAHDALPDGRNSFVNFPRDAGSERVVFEGSWPQGGGEPPETLWQRDPGEAPVPAVSRELDNTVSPCVLGDGAVVALWLGRPGGTGAHELTYVGTDGSWRTLVPDEDVADIGIGCTTR